VKQGNITAPSIAPVDKDSLKLNLPADWKNYDALTLSAYDPYKDESYRWGCKAKSYTILLEKILATGKSDVTVSENDSLLTLKSAGISVILSKKTGKLSSLANDNSALLSFRNGPVLVSGNATFTGLKHFKEGDSYI